MFGRNKAPTPQNNSAEDTQKDAQAFDKALDWESSKIRMIAKSERKAWVVAAAAVGVTVLLSLAIFMMLPLKENTPYVMRVDNVTGAVDIVTALDVKTMKYDEVMDKYWLAQYVRARETYDWYTLQRDYNAVGLLSAPIIGAEYTALFEGKDALDKKYGNTIRTTVEIVSVIPNGRNIGTVHFIKTSRRTDDPKATGSVTKWVATLGYEYRNPSMIREQHRLVNPFGFQVLSYRVDPEMGGATP